MKKYNIIYADPPWAYNESGSGNRTVGSKYPTMQIEEIERLPVQSLSADDCILFLWVTFPRLEEGLRTIRAWGFKYHSLGFVWVKTTKNENTEQAAFFVDDPQLFWGMGYYTRQNAEICLVGTRGKIKPLRHDVHSVVIENIRRHSEKPQKFRDKIIQICGDMPRLEMFARMSTPGWDVWGNEVKCDLAI